MSASSPRRWALLLLLTLAWPASAALRIHTSSGVPVRWFPADLPLSFVVQAAGSDDVPDASDDLAVRRAFAVWAAAPEVELTLLEESDPAERARTDWQADDNRLVLFDEDGDATLFPPQAGFVAVTPIQYLVSSGRIVDADIVLNGAEIAFATNGAGNAFDVRAVVSHEVGHLLGLAHSGLGHASMTPFVSPGGLAGRTLTADDRAGMASVYPSGAGVGGAVEGRVRRAGGALVSGAQVHARGADGRVQAAGFSDAQGRYALGGLAPGSYRLVAAPVDGPLKPAQLANPAGLPPFEDDFQPVELSVEVGAGLLLAPDLVVAPEASLRILGPPLAWPLRAGEQRVIQLDVQGYVGPGSVEVVGAGEALEVDELVFLPGAKLLRFEVEADADAAPGGYDLRVTSSAGARAVAPGFLELLPPEPRLDSLAPGCGLAGGGALLELHGEFLGSTVEVRLGDAVAPAFLVLDDERLLVTQPASASGPLDVVVLTAGGDEATLAGSFVALPGDAPAPLLLFPAAGSSAGGTQASLQGAGFEPGDSVLVGGQPAGVSVVDASRVELVLPPLPEGVHDLLVIDGDCDAVSALLPGAWASVPGPDPQVSAVSPEQVTHAGGDTALVLGSGFVEGASVELLADLSTGTGGLPVPTWLLDAGSLLIDLPALPLGPAALLVRLPDGRVAVAPAALDVLPLLAGKDTLDGGIGEAGETDEAWLDGLAGTLLSATLRRKGKQSALVPRLELRDAAGEVLLSSDPTHPAFDALLVKSSPSKASLRKLVLPSTERYTLVLSGLEGSLGDYRLKLTEKLPPEAKALALPKQGAPTAGPEPLVLPLLAKAGSTVSGKLTAKDELQLVFVSLVDPDGVVLLDDDPDGLSGPPALMAAVTLDPEGRFIKFKQLPLAAFGEHLLSVAAAPGTTGSVSGKLKIKPPKGKTQLTE